MRIRSWHLPPVWQHPLGLALGLTLGLGGLGGGIFMGSSGARAEINPDLLPSLDPLDLSALQQAGPPPCPEEPSPGTVKTALTICQSRLTNPSLWWAKQLYGDTLVDNWVTHLGNPDEPGRVDVVVNSQVWNTWNYLERYAFIDRFGVAAQRQGFNVRVFDWQSRFLAAYTCDFDAPTMVSLLPPPLTAGETRNDLPPMDQLGQPPLTCSVLLNPSGRSALRGRSSIGPTPNPN